VSESCEASSREGYSLQLTTKLRLQLAGFTLIGAVCSDEVQIIEHLTCGTMDKPKRIWKAMLTLLIAVLEALVFTLSSAPGRVGSNSRFVSL